MRLFDANSSYWAIRHIYVFLALAGVAIIVIGYLVSYYLNEQDALLDMIVMYGVGGGLIIISPIIAVGYMLIRRGETVKLKGSNVS